MRYSVDPLVGGIERVNYNLSSFLNTNDYLVYSLSFLEHEETVFKKCFYFKHKENILNKENIEYYQYILMKEKIDIVILSHANDPKMMKLAIQKDKRVVLISHYHNSPFGLSGFIKFFISRNYLAPIISNKLGYYLSLYYNKIRNRSTYKRMVLYSDKVVLLSESFREELKFFIKYDNSKIIVLPNPVISVNYSIKPKNKEIIYVGRINSYQKGFDNLLNIWKILMLKIPDWNLTIIGGGVELEKYILRSNKMGLERIKFENFQNPKKYYERAQFLFMTSNFEGFPMVLVEAMQYGCIPIAFDSFSSLKDIIDNKTSGYIIPACDIKYYTLTILNLINDNEIIAVNQRQAIEKAKSFDISIIGPKWLNLFENLLRNKK